VIFGGGGLINHEPHWNLLINAAIAFSKGRRGDSA